MKKENQEMHPAVDVFISKAKNWQEEYKRLRAIILDCGLTEDFKWMHPCYTFENNNVVIIQGFKEYCAIMFVKGALLKDAGGILKTPGEHQAARQIRFTGIQGINALDLVLKAYIHEAIAVEKAGLKVAFKKTEDFVIPEEFQRKLNEDSALKTAFEALTPGRQRAYIFHFSQPKQSKTREARVEKCIPQILDGLGLND